MRKGLKKFLRIGGWAAGGFILLLAAAALLFLLDKPLVKNLAQKYLAKKAGITLQVGALDYKLFPLRIVISSLKATYETPIFTMDVLVNRVEAKGKLGKLLNGELPAFETADIDIADLRFNQKKISETPIDFESIILQTAHLLSNAQRVVIKCGRMGFSLPAQNFHLEDVRLSLAATKTAGTYDLLLEAKHADAATNDGSLSFESGLHAEGTAAPARTTGIDLRLGLDAPRFVAAGKSSSLKALTLEARGDWMTGKDTFSIAKLALGVPDLVTITGSGAADLGGTASLDLSVQARVDSLQSLAAIASSYLPQSIREARLQGKTRMEGHYVLAAGERLNAGKLEASVELDGVKLDYAQAAFPIHGRVSGLLKFAGSLLDLRASADIRAAIDGISKDDLNVRKTLARLQVKASRKAAEFTNFEGTLQGLAFSFPGKKTLAFDDVPFKGAARLDFDRKSIALTALEACLPNLAPLRLSGRFDLDPRGVRQARLESNGLKLSALRRLLAPLMPGSLAGWDFDGALDIGVEAGSFPDQKGVWKFSSDLALSQAKFNDPSSTLAGEGLQPVVRIKGIYEPAKGVVDWTGAVELAHGESLLKDFYISWGDQPLKADVAGRFSLAARTVDGLTARVVLPTLGEIHADGEARLETPSSFQLRAGARLSLGPLYALYSQAGVSPENRLRLSGELSGDFEIAKEGDALRIKGRLAVEEAGIENLGAQVAVRGIKADVPVNYLNGPATGTAGADDRAGASEKGVFQVREIRTPSQTFPPIALTLHSLTNAYRIDPFSLDILGVRLEFGETAVAIDPRTGAFHAGTSLKLPGFDLSRLKVGSASSPVSGRARAEFPVLDITAARITTSGRAEFDIFGGRVVVRDVAVDTPFSAGRVLSCNVDLLDLDLKKVTDVVPFGGVTGIIRGRVLGLTITYGQPESFNLSLESVPRKGVAQTFSLKAIDNLTVLSSGQRAATGSSPFWMRFMRGFHYAKIGIVSTLRNDAFTLNGTIHEKGLEYLVKRSALFGIDVVNRMPETKISFKDMMSRLERVGRSENPEVKK
jgi:hypothetical protein